MGYLLRMIALGAVYYGGAKIGFELEFVGPVAGIVWLPAGIGIAGLYLGGLRLLPGVLVGDLLANDYGRLPLGSALGQTAGNMLELTVAVLIMRRLIRRDSPLDGLADLGGMLLAIACGAAVSATIGVTVNQLGDVTRGDHFWTLWRTWWLADLCGGIVVVPLVLAWRRRPPPGWWRRCVPEMALMLVAVAGLSHLAFHTDRPLTYIVFPALAWAALRTGARGTTLAIAVTVGFATWNTNHYLGPFVFDSITRMTVNTQLFIAVAALTALCLSAAMAERERFAAQLAASRVRLVAAADSARQRIERDLHDGTQQHLIALAAQLGLAARRVREEPEQAAHLLEDADRDLTAAIAELREIAHGLHPAVLSDLGLATAIKSMALQSRVPIRVLDVPAMRLDVTTEATGYYVVAEAIDNAQKHARASSIEVCAVAAGHGLQIDVTDDGVGGADADAGGGLRGLRDRVEAVGGTFRLVSPTGRGTRIAVAIPAPERSPLAGDPRDRASRR